MLPRKLYDFITIMYLKNIQKNNSGVKPSRWNHLFLV